MHHLYKRGENSSRSLLRLPQDSVRTAAEGGRAGNEPVQGASAGGACWSSLDASAVLLSMQRCSMSGRRSGRCRSSCGRLSWPEASFGSDRGQNLVRPCQLSEEFVYV